MNRMDASWYLRDKIRECYNECMDGEGERKFDERALEGRRQEAARIKRETLAAAYDTGSDSPPPVKKYIHESASPIPTYDTPPELAIETTDLVPPPESKRVVAMRDKVRGLWVDLYLTGESNFVKDGITVSSYRDFIEADMADDEEVVLGLSQGDTTLGFSRNGVTFTSGVGEDKISRTLSYNDLKGSDLRMVNASLKGANKLFLPEIE